MFRPGKTQQITDHIWMLRTLFSNLYLYSTNEGYIAFDCGIHPILVRQAMHKLDIEPKLVQAVFLTHSDMDHKGGLRLFPQATIYLPDGEVPLITGQKARRGFVYNSGIKKYTTLSNGESIVVGKTEVKMIAAPGHTPGSACYLIGEDAIATGDLLLISASKQVCQFSIVQNMDHAGNLSTLKRLVAEGLFANERYLLTGHSGAEKASTVSFVNLK